MTSAHNCNSTLQTLIIMRHAFCAHSHTHRRLLWCLQAFGRADVIDQRHKLGWGLVPPVSSQASNVFFVCTPALPFWCNWQRQPGASLSAHTAPCRQDQPDPIFSYIEAQHGQGPWGSVLDAGWAQITIVTFSGLATHWQLAHLSCNYHLMCNDSAGLSTI
jgi:hypothetical protein